MTSGTRPSDCLNPTTPHHAAGIRADPPPSVASANDTIPSATAAALPPDDPPLLRVGANGLPVGPKSWLSQTPLKPKTGLFVLPSTIAPAASMRSTHEQLKSGVKLTERGHAAERRRPAGLEVEEVLHRGRDAVQRADRLAAHERLLRRARLVQRLVDRQEDERVQRGVAVLDPPRGSLDGLHG